MNSENQIPTFYYKLLKWFCKEDLWDELQGDLEESFQLNRDKQGIVYAKKIYKREVLKLIRPSVIKKLNPIQMNSSSGLFLNYIKIAFRTLLKDKTHATISILGLSLGITTAVLLIQFNKFEESYDTFHTKSESIFRIRNDVKSNTSGEITSTRSYTFFAAHPALSKEIPEIINSTHIRDIGGIIKYKNKSFKEDEVLLSTASLFEIFSFELLKGNYKDLDETRMVFISKSLATKLFADANPIDKKIEFDDAVTGVHFDLTVRGVFKDIPDNSHIKAEMIVPMAEHIRNIIQNQSFGPNRTVESVKWRWTDFHTYIEAHEGFNAKNLKEKINAVYFKYRQQVDERLGRTQLVSLQPLSTIHLESNLDGELDPPGNKDLVLFFYLVTALILIIAWINYVNMATAKAMNRGREVGIRKVLGAYKKQLVFQFLFESLLINTIAILISIGLLALVIPSFELFIQKNIFNQFFELSTFWGLFGFSILTGAILSGIYPAFVLSSFQPSKVLKVSFKYTGHGIWLRKGLVLLQFVIAIFLLSGATAIQSQLSYMINHDPGINIDRTIIVNTPVFSTRDSTYNSKISSLLSSMGQEIEVEKYTVTSLIPGMQNSWRGSCGLLNNPDQESAYFSRASASPEFIETFDLNLIAGRNFDQNGDSLVVLINRKGAQSLGFANPEDVLEQTVTFPGNQNYKVVGVIENYYQNGLLTDFEPLAIQLDKTYATAYLTLKIKGNNIKGFVNSIDQKFTSIFPETAFEYFFLDESFNAQYHSDQKFQQIFNYFTLIAVFIACLGLLGLSSFFMTQKKKEVTVRKVLGASISSIVKLLLKEYAWLILISGIVSIPIAYLVIDTWLNNYVFRISINPLMFLVPIMLLSSVIILTISNQTWKTATANPTDHLKNE